MTHPPFRYWRERVRAVFEGSMLCDRILPSSVFDIYIPPRSCPATPSSPRYSHYLSKAFKFYSRSVRVGFYSLSLNLRLATSKYNGMYSCMIFRAFRGLMLPQFSKLPRPCFSFSGNTSRIAPGTNMRDIQEDSKGNEESKPTSTESSLERLVLHPFCPDLLPYPTRCVLQTPVLLD